MADLERRLSELGAQVAYPPTPDLAPAVAAGVAAPAAAPRRPVRRLALAAAALVLLLAATAAAVPAAREAVLEWVGIEGVEVRVLPEPPDVVHGATLLLGERVGLREGEERTGVRARLPRALEGPDAVYATGNRLTLRYGGLLLTEGASGRAAFQKELGPGTRAARVTFDGNPGVYIEGAPHGVRADGEELRIAGDTLLWSDGAYLFRLEGAASEAEALRIARSVR
jgi:hypothetical protein